MKATNYAHTEENEKCQCITLDENGTITGSCDTLFVAGKITGTGMKRKFPFLSGILSYLKDLKKGAEPLFFPQVFFECNGYHSICDFTFMKTVDARGVQRFIWMIYDNSIHYQQLIKNSGTSKIKKPKLEV